MGRLHRATARRAIEALDEEVVRERADRGHDWKGPVWRNVDGSFAEW